MQVRLYDESENLIESKFLSKAESVECSKSFTMGSHLVDIADPIHLASNPTVTSLAQQNGNLSVCFFSLYRYLKMITCKCSLL